MSITQPSKKGFRFEIRPTEEQKEFLAKTFGCCRYVYNRGLAEAKLEYENWLKQKEQGILNPPKSICTGFEFVNRMVQSKKLPEHSFLLTAGCPKDIRVLLANNRL